MPTSSKQTANEILKRDPEFKPHLKALGLETVEEYTAWCARHGFSVRLDKHWKERCKERYFAAQQAIQDRLAHKKYEQRKPRGAIQKILTGDLGGPSLTQAYLRLIHQSVTNIDDEQVREAFGELLLHTERNCGFLTTRPAFPQFGTQDGNTFIEGLLGLARSHSQWIRPLRGWKTRTHNVRRQFSSLASYLLAKFPAPSFMDSVWFRGQTIEATRQQGWYKAIVSGRSPRDLDMPIQLTKRMTHHFLKAPKEFTVDAALRYGQVRGLGGTARLAEAIIGSPIATAFENDEFWSTVIHWFIENPMFDPAQISPMIDYINRQKFEPQEVVIAPGQAELRALHPDFSMKGRTAESLLRQMRQWHAQLRKEPEREELEWAESGFGSFDWSEGVLATNNLRRWTIVELLSRKELYQEGRMMRHCVASYDNSCAFGGTSIWSMGVERNLERRKRVLTIEVVNSTKSICQIRGKANRLASEKEMNIVRRWASQEKLDIAKFVGTN